ncbi:hypothetical protein [Allorhodopirellula heiligendammensis]|uniref:Phage major tail protein 2 n=1 Tax=Allorhodopirellula heiligendammensis TaxID=2714739 RepID=A0A5C6C0D1_9BACT|nr:hypothetical protein [Allorhodopirellula heiligendammensis]TWU17990.1 hypothetical protein Poly21_01430 [Allorhodopirellula heiligendammensis]
MSGNPVIGKDCVLASFPISGWASPVYSTVENAKNVSQPGVTKNMISLMARSSGGWDLKGAGFKSMDLQFGYLYETEDTVLAMLRDSYVNDTIIGFAVLDGPSDGVHPEGTDAGDAYDVEGWKFAGMVSEFPTGEELEEGKTYDIKVDAARYKLSGTLLLPTWVTIAGTVDAGE